MAGTWRKRLRRKVSANLRDTRLLLGEFAWPLLAFAVAIAGGGALYTELSKIAGEPLTGFAEGMYQVLELTFLQSLRSFPQAWYLQAFYFIMPVIGIGILAQGVADFGVLFFNRKARSKEWEMAVASTFQQHIILIGLGHLGFRVVRSLNQMDQEVVAVELNPTADLVASVKRLGVPVIQDDALRDVTLEAAGITKARAVVLCTQNDSLNLQIALKARKFNPKVQIILRIFDESFAQALQEQFGFTAMSATGMAAPAFAAAATGMDMTAPITIEGAALSLARLKISPVAAFASLTAGEVEQKYNLSVVWLSRNGIPDLHPAPERCLLPGDTLAILGGPTEIGCIMQDNPPKDSL